MRFAVLAFGALLQFGGAAYAASCSTHPSGGDALLAGSPGDLDTSDMTFRASQADDCSGLYQGNNSAAEVRTVAAQLGSALDPLQPQIKADGAATIGAALYDGVLWSLSYQTTGWKLSYSAEPDLIRIYDVIAVLKQATGWAVFRFAGEVFATDDTAEGTFFIDWCGGSRNPSFECSSDDLSHLSVYLSRVEIAEPGALLLVAFALAGLASSRRRRKCRNTLQAPRRIVPCST